jgi:3-deoxy-D-manno-octulosonate 8-phosphate phosphatase (KDO 8-P phosphatase)
VKAVAHVVTRARGGQGAVRELVELLLRAQRSWHTVVAAYVREHGGSVRRTPSRGRGPAGGGAAQ